MSAIITLTIFFRVRFQIGYGEHVKIFERYVIPAELHLYSYIHIFIHSPTPSIMYSFIHPLFLDVNTNQSNSGAVMVSSDITKSTLTLPRRYGKGRMGNGLLFVKESRPDSVQVYIV